MRRWVSVIAVVLSVLAGWTFSAAAEQSALVMPGLGIGRAWRGMSAETMVRRMGEPDWIQANPNGTFLLEWGLLPPGGPRAGAVRDNRPT